MARWWLRATLVASCVVVCLLARAGDDPKAKNKGPALPGRAAVDAYILGPTELIAGTRGSYRVAVHWASAPGRSGPLPGAHVGLRLATSTGGLDLAEGLTDRTGNADLRFTVPRLGTGRYSLNVAVRSRLGGATRKHEVQIYPGGRLLLTTDKKLYQPSQVIHVRALALRSMDLRPVARRPVRIQVTDPKGNVVFDQQGRTSRFGVASLDFQLADEINLGHYMVAAWTEGAGESARSQKRVEVRRYVLPKLKVTVETERRYYRPGETVRGTVRCRYFFGKPVDGAKVALDIRSRLGVVTQYGQPLRRTDSQGRATFEVQLARGGGQHTGEVRVLARVTDSAGHREQGDLSVPLTARPLRLSVVTENDRLVRGVHNRVHVIAGYPDGRPAPGTRVTLRAPGAGEQSATTDALGVATLQVMPRQRQGCERLGVEARDPLGEQQQSAVCAPLAHPGSALVRPARSLVAPGEPVELDLFARAARAGAARAIFVDVVKAGQTLATFSARLQRGRARVRFQPDAALFGLLELRAYRLKRDGDRVGLSRVIYVDHPGELKISVTPDKAVHRPGERARLSFRTVDSRTGDGVQAALGVLGVDEAVIALGGLEPESSPKIFFTLASQARGGEEPAVPPGGQGLESWVAAEGTEGKRARAADVLLAAVRPVETAVWETNPWRERTERWATQAPELVSAAVAFMSTHSVGQRTRRGWRFHPDLVPRMARAGAVKLPAVVDPWKRVVRPWHLRSTDPSFVFDRHARRIAPQKLERIYESLADCWDTLKLPRERMRKLARKQWPLVLPRDLLVRLVELGKLKRSDIVDPWGQAYRIAPSPQLYVNPYYTGLVSRYLIHSAGPDGVSGTKDDVGPTGPRVAVQRFGKDSALGVDGEDALGGLIGNAIGEAYGVGGLGLMGTGRGGGGAGEGTIGLGTLGTIGHGGGGGSMPARVRSRFPETLLWEPELITDKSGRATLEVELADSITDWRVVTTGSTTSGLLGRATTTLRVFQDFFVDIDLPVALTQGDRVSVPVSVYNYLETPQRVTLRLARESWFTASGPVEQTIELGPGQVGVRHFPIVARGVGRRDLTVHARASGGLADAVRRTTLVEPDGVERALSLGGSLRQGGTASHELAIPDSAIDGTGRVQLAIYAGPMGQALDGMEGMLRRPYGCFEQTSSTTYPNLLVLDYLKRTGQVTPQVEKKARALINEGYQRLIGFEVQGGGFSWFGNAPANRVLTAYGLMEFFDMARVHPVDPRLIARTQRWLAREQRPDGTWAPDAQAINEGATNHYRADALRITAYIAHALRHTGYRGPALKKALGYVKAHVSRATDPYTLAVLGNLFARDDHSAARSIRRRLWEQRHSSDKGLYFEAPRSTLTYGAGDSGRLETTALGALALLESREAPTEATRLVDTLVASKDSFGSWHSTQATILSLRALLKRHEVSRVKPEGEVEVLVDGHMRRRLRLRGERDATHQIDLTPHVKTGGRHRVELRFARAKGNLQYHLSGRYWIPRTEGRAASTPPAALAIQTRFDRLQARPGQKIQLDVEVRNRAAAPVEMPLVSLSLPPGFTLQPDGLTGLVRAGKVDKVQQVGNRAVLYLTRLGARSALRFGLSLQGKYPLAVQARPSTVYEYYRPENRAQSAPHLLKVL